MSEERQELPLYPFAVFQEQAMRTAKEISPEGDLMHACLGICSEAGEFADALKKSYAYDKEFDTENALEELGDILWFVALACKSLGVPMDYVAVKCIEKLYKRYPEKFSNELAQERRDKNE